MQLNFFPDHSVLNEQFLLSNLSLSHTCLLSSVCRTDLQRLSLTAWSKQRKGR